MNYHALSKLTANQTLLGVGPMSRNVVDATIESAANLDTPIFLVASRRQVDSADMGGGYTNNWCTKKFCSYVKENDKKNLVLLARDHGGPWQNSVELGRNYSLNEAMESAKKSFQIDIDHGISFIHIDPSVTPNAEPLNIDTVLERVFELYEHCFHYSKLKNKPIHFEIGTEEQKDSLSDSLEEIEYVLNKIKDYTLRNNFPMPLFIVVQTGTKVMGLDNIGTFKSDFSKNNWKSSAHDNIKKIVNLANEFQIGIKIHNGDYLSHDLLNLHPQLGLHAINIAPELGVKESMFLVELFEQSGLKNLSESFLELAYLSRKWCKWTEGIEASDREKSLLAGHYIFSTDQFHEIKNSAQRTLIKKGINIDEHLKSRLEKVISSILSSLKC